MKIKKRLIIIGAGRRVREDVLPVVRVMHDTISLEGMYARHASILEDKDGIVAVRTMSELSKEIVSLADWIYVAVPAKALSEVLASLSRFAPSRARLILDTPVIPWRMRKMLSFCFLFSDVTVAEDAVYLPWIDLLRSELGGSIQEMVFDHSAYRYHGIALAKACANGATISSARFVTSSDGSGVVQLIFSDGKKMRCVEPRNYASGSMVFTGINGALTDRPSDSTLGFGVMIPLIRSERCVGLRIGKMEQLFSQSEIDLIGHVAPDATITSLTLALKRIGLLRLLSRLLSGDVGYAVSSALEDVWLDECVHRFGRWFNIAPVVTAMITFQRKKR